MIEPSFIDLEQLQVVGQVVQVDVKATNHGLIAAKDLGLNFGSHPFYRFEPLINQIDTLGAKSSITIPVRITRIADFDTLGISSNELQTQSGGSVPCSISASIDYSYECAGETIERDIPLPIFNVEGDCSGTGTPGGGGWWWFSSGPGGPGGPGGGNWPGGSSQIDIVIADEDCDPCKEKNLQALSCIIRSLGSKLKGLPGAVVTGINCWVNVANGIKDFKEGNYLDLPKPSDICDPPDILDCLEKLCFDDILGNSSIATADSLVLGISELTPASTATGLRTLQRYSSYWHVYKAVTAHYYGADVWTTIPDEQQPTLQVWREAFKAFSQGDTIEAFKISDAELVQLLALDRPAPISENDIRNYLSRWNRSVDYYAAGILTTADLQPGQNPDFLSLDVLDSLTQQINAFTQVLASEGYEDLEDATLGLSRGLYESLSGEGGVCATVKVKIDQDAVMTRAAFLGSLEISNGNQASLQNLAVTLQILDSQGKVVNDLFGITNPILSNITAVDGSGVLTGDDPTTPQNEGIGSAQWTFIPTNFAAPEVPTQYSIGGSLSYLENGSTVTVPLLAAPITVYPQAELYLDYFHQRDVFADDPFTENVEISVPYKLAVLIRNGGKGAATDLKITSGQPKIIENEKGLLIDFQIIGSEVNGKGVSPSLTADFGNIAAGGSAVAEWLLKSSLQGKFVDYSATFVHENSLGKKELSLIKDVQIHELIHTVLADHGPSDQLKDYLVNDVFDSQFTPDTLYFSSGGTAPVKAVINATIDGAPSVNDLDVVISATVDTGWTFFRLPEPSDSNLQLVRLQRADGSLLSSENFWTTDRTFPGTGRPIYENILQFFDYTQAGSTTYTAIYEPGGPTVTRIIPVSPDPIGAAVNTITLDFSEPINTTSFDFQDLTLTLNGGPNLITSAVSVLGLSPTRYQASGLSSLTQLDGDYEITVNATGVRDSGGLHGFGTAVEQWSKALGGLIDSTPPQVLDVVDLLIKPRNEFVASLSVSFSEALDLSSFTWQDITLSRNGGPNLVTSGVTISSIAESIYRIGGLAGLTGADGPYTISVDGSGVKDLAGNSGVGQQSESWEMDTTAPAAPTAVVVAGLQADSLGLAGALQIGELTSLTSNGQLRIQTLAPSISGQLSEPGLKVLVTDHQSGRTLAQATVSGQTFSAAITLPSPGAQEIDLVVEDRAGNRSTRNLALFADVTPPAITEFLNVPSASPTSVDTIDVRFSEPIKLATFDASDLRLTRDGFNVPLPVNVTVAEVVGQRTTYRISGLAAVTSIPGNYGLRLDATTITDLAGNIGLEPASTSFAVTTPPLPGVLLAQTGVNTSVAEGGNVDSYNLSLRTQPTAEVRIALSVPAGQVTLDRYELIFTPQNWSTPQSVVVSAIDDALTEGSQTTTIKHVVSSGDSNYGGLTVPDLNVLVQDNDASIRGRVWNDADGNGIDNGEAPLPGWRVFIDSDFDGALDVGERTAISDANGAYAFEDLRPGLYGVTQVLESGWRQTYPVLDVSTTASSLPLVLPAIGLDVPAEGPTTLNFSSPNFVVKEDGTAVAEVWVTRTGDLSKIVSATLHFSDGTATGCGCAPTSVSNDYNFNPITITFAANQSRHLVPVENALLANPGAIRIRNDSKAEASEFFNIQLSNPSTGAVIGDQGAATVTIIDDDSSSGEELLASITAAQSSLPKPAAAGPDKAAAALIGLDQFFADPRFAAFRGQGFSTVVIDTGIDADHLY